MEEKAKEKVADSYSIDDEDLEKEEPTKVNENQGEEKKTQSREEDSKFADYRRTKKENERLKEKVSKLEEDLRNLKNTSIDRDTLEDLGLENVNDDNSYRVAKKYQDYKKDGNINAKEKTYEELYKELLGEKEEQEKAKNEEIKRKELIEEDAKKLKKVYNITPKEAFADKNFMDAYGNLIKYGNLSDLYGSYMAVKNAYEKGIREKQKEKGSLPTSESNSGGEKTYLQMSKEERNKHLKSKYKI